MSERAAVSAWLIARAAELLGVSPAIIAPDEPFVGFGLSSLQAVQLSDDLQRWTGLTLSPTLAYDYPTIAEVAEYVAGEAGKSGASGRTAAGPAEAGRGGRGPVAIVGVGCRLPGASGPSEFWRLLSAGIDAISEVPADRWDVLAPHVPPGRVSPRWGGFLSEVDGFDAACFGVAAREAARMDPQQRIALEVTREALHDAGIPAGELAGSRTSVFLGAATYDHGTAVMSTQEGLEPYDGTGSALSIIANRVSYCLDLRGPSLVIDTACSSSLVAIHLAAQSLRQGEVEVAIAGGVNVITSGRIAASFSAGGLMAADGRCKPFDRRADGYVRSEGAGVVILKPLAKRWPTATACTPCCRAGR